MKEAGLLPYADAAARKQSLAVGSRATFSVHNFDTGDYDNIDFTLKKDLTRYTIWVETALLGGTVSDAQIDALDAALGQSTPSGSFDSSNGIIENNEVIFGNPPDVDGDSKTDILLLDIRDDPSQGFVVLGFFDPRDLGLNGNQADIIYLDTNPGLNVPETILATAAHEYQHLIMAEYDPFEDTFVNEAQSEWAELMNGYNGRSMSFLGQDVEHATDFFEYRESVGGILDRERGQLFTLFLAEQLSPQIAGAVTRQAARNQSGYGATDVLGSLEAFQDLVVDFHVANLIGDTSFGPEYGYENQYYTSVRTTPDRTIDGRLETSIGQTNLSMKGGAVNYVEFTDVTDFELELDVNPSDPALIGALRGFVEVRALIEESGSSMVEQEFALNGDLMVFPGTHDRIRLVIVNKRAQRPAAASIPVQYSAEWSTATTSTVVTVAYDDGNPSREYFFTEGLVAQMTSFPIPDGDEVTIDRVLLAPFYENQFGNSELPPTEPRDVELLVLDGTDGFPDLNKEIFSMTVVDPRPYAGTTPTAILNHFEVDLSAHSAELGNLPAEVFVGYVDTGTDVNYTVLAPAVYSTENTSFYGNRSTNSWSRLWDVTGGTCCNERVIPVRVNFLVTTIVDVDEDAPQPTASLAQNYPNPFSGSTVIEFEVPNAEHVELSVFDVLGRRVTTLANDTFVPGRHRVTLDGSGLASGLYLLRMRTVAAETTRTLIRL